MALERDHPRDRLIEAGAGGVTTRLEVSGATIRAMEAGVPLE
jgi:hypothetical protein